MVSVSLPVIGGARGKVDPALGTVWGATVGAGADEVVDVAVLATDKTCKSGKEFEVTDVVRASALMISPIETPSATTAVDLDQGEHECDHGAPNMTDLTEPAIANPCNNVKHTYKTLNCIF